MNSSAHTRNTHTYGPSHGHGVTTSLRKHPLLFFYLLCIILNTEWHCSKTRPFDPPSLPLFLPPLCLRRPTRRLTGVEWRRAQGSRSKLNREYILTPGCRPRKDSGAKSHSGLLNPKPDRAAFLDTQNTQRPGPAEGGLWTWSLGWSEIML